MTAEPLTRYQDQVVGEAYRLGTVLGATTGSVVYETAHGEEARPAVIKIRPGDTPDAEQVLARWQAAMALADPHLIRIYAAGRSELGGNPVIYAVMERADETLATVVAERVLSEQETRELLEPTLLTLAYLHKNGYVHGSLKPSNILACGENLKLSSDSVARVEDGASPADDMWFLGVTLVQALTHQQPVIEEDSGPYILRDAGEPFTEIVRHTLDPEPQKRWTVEQIAARLNPALLNSIANVPRAQPAPPHKPAEPTAPNPPLMEAAPDLMDAPKEAVAEPEPAPRPIAVAAVEPKARVTPPAPAVTPPFVREDFRRAPAPPDEAESVTSDGGRRKLIYAGVGTLALVALVVGLLGRKTDSVPPAAPVAVAPAPQAAPPDAKPLAENPRPPGPATHSQPPAAADTGNRRASGWAVVVASYSGRGPAEKRAHQLARKYPHFKFEVYDPPQNPHHLVVIGKNLSEDRAAALRKRATSSGLPRDTFIKRFPG